jgi:chromate reductase
MKQYQIVVVVGSLRKDSFNRQLANAIIKLAPSHIRFKFLEIGNLPLYNQDHDNNQSDSVKSFKSDIASADGVLFVTPEYNRSIPGVLKNALDNASRPYGQNAWAGKPAGILSASVGATGGALSQQHLRNVIAYLDMPTLNQPEAFIQVKEGLYDSDGNIGPNSKKFLQGWMDKFVAWIERNAKT